MSALWKATASGLFVMALALPGRAADLAERVKGSDVVAVGQVIAIAEGEQNPDIEKMGVKFRTDIAVIVVTEVLKGDPALRKVKVAFPAFPREGQVKLKEDQAGVWLLAKSDRKGLYEVRKADDVLPEDRLGAVRRAVRKAAGLAGGAAQPADKAALARELEKGLAAEEPGSRRLAAYRLGELGATGAAPRLIEALNDDSPSVRLTADIALRKITGRRVQVDFRNGSPEDRARGIRAWKAWWAKNNDRDRLELLTEAVEQSIRPQPDFQYAIDALADYDDRTLAPLFRRALDSAVSAKNDLLANSAARYLGRVKDRSSAKRLAALIQASWPSTSTQAAAAAALGNIAGKDFGPGSEGINKCILWWREHGDEFN
jgi:hypothetical protein